MSAPRWFADSPRDQLGIGGLTEYPSEADANAAAGTAGRVLALVTPEYIRECDEFRAELARLALDHAQARGEATALRAERDLDRWTSVRFQQTIDACREADEPGVVMAANLAHARAERDELREKLARSRAANQSIAEQHKTAVNGMAELARKLHEAHAAVLDIDAHATPYGDIPDEPGWVGTYLVTAGALHRALGKVGHSAPKCQAEADLELMRQAVDAQRELRRVAEEKLIAVATTVEQVRALADQYALGSNEDDALQLVALLRKALAADDAPTVGAGISGAAGAGHA